MVEVALMAPWIFFLFVGVLDLGFYCYALIAVQNAARVATIAVSGSQGTASDIAYANTFACTAVLQEMQMLPNAQGLTGCAAAPLVVTTSRQTDASGSFYWQVTVTYDSVPLIPIPGVLTGQLHMIRSAEVKQGS
jgi:Flp pilus assembly protein TadG